MTTTSILPPKPRRRPAPSARDQQIYLDYQTTGRSQEELAKDYELTQCRISQIIHRVEAWMVGRWSPSARNANQPTTANPPPNNDAPSLSPSLPPSVPPSSPTTHHAPRTPINSTCAPPPSSPQPRRPKPLALKLPEPKNASRLIVPAGLEALFDKVLRLRQMQFKGLPCMFYFTPEEESQMWRLPPIILEDS